MIYAFTGKTGSGKTFNMVRLAFEEWKSGRDIYSNTILDFEYYGGPAGEEVKNWKETIIKKIKKDYEPLKRGRITYFEDINELIDIKNGLIMIDEAQVLFNARNWEALPYEFQYKLQQHRKHRLDLYCTTQNMGTIDISYRRLVQKWYHHYDIFALFGLRNPSLFSVHRVEEKDIDRLYNNVDDLLVDTVANSYLFIHKFKKRLYDTMFDIGFKAFSQLWLNEFNKETNQWEQKIWFIPKQMQLKDVLRLKSLYQSALGLKTSRYSK